MCDIYKEGLGKSNKKSNIIKNLVSKNSIKSNTCINIINDFTDLKPLKPETIQSGSQSPSSFTNPSSPNFKQENFLQNFTIKTLPSYDQYQLKFSQINSKSQRFLKVANDLKNKISLLEEIYDGPEYKKFKVKNKLIQCSVNIDTSEKIVFNLISKLNPDDNVCCGRSIHPAYSHETVDDPQTFMENSDMIQVPFTSHEQMQPMSDIKAADGVFVNDYQPVDNSQNHSSSDESFFLEHEGNTYVRVDDINYHLIQSISHDGIITTETGLQLAVPPSTKIQVDQCMQDMQISDDAMVTNINNNDYSSLSNQDHFYVNPVTEPVQQISVGGGGRNSYKDNSFLTHYTYQTSNPAKPFSDYVGLPPRPPPHMPFTLSSQLYTPELSISLTDRNCELMLTIDCSKKNLPQQQSLYYQIYSYKDEDRHLKPTSEVWSLVGEIRACALPMFCTISIPSGVHKHYFSIRSVDQFNRFSDWSNVVQVEVESSISTGSRGDGNQNSNYYSSSTSNHSNNGGGDR